MIATVYFYMKTTVDVMQYSKSIDASNPTNLLEVFGPIFMNIYPIDWASGVKCNVYLKLRGENKYIGNNNYSYSEVFDCDEIFEDPSGGNQESIGVCESNGKLLLTHKLKSLEAAAVSIQLELDVKKFDWPLASRNDLWKPI